MWRADSDAARSDPDLLVLMPFVAPSPRGSSGSGGFTLTNRTWQKRWDVASMFRLQTPVTVSPRSLALRSTVMKPAAMW